MTPLDALLGLSLFCIVLAIGGSIADRLIPPPAAGSSSGRRGASLRPRR